jgi:hypothetical protein
MKYQSIIRIGMLALVALAAISSALALSENDTAAARRPTPTPRATHEHGRTRTPAATRVDPATIEPDATETAEATVEPTVTGEATTEPTTEPTPTEPPAPGHDVTEWHAPALYHDHGANPADAHPVLREAIAGFWTQEIGSAWLSSPHENEFPEGMHAAFTNLNEVDTNCDPGRLGPNDTCIDSYFLQIHAAGSNAHGRVDVHSWKAALWVCAKSGSPCGYILTGGHHDYIWTHAPYKAYFCEESNGQPDPVLSPSYQLSQVPYTALGTEHRSNGQSRIFWNSLGPNAVTLDDIEAQRGYIPNRGLQLVWSEADAWDYVQGGSQACADATQDTRFCEDDDTTCADNGNAFQLFAIRYDNLPTARPFYGYTDRWGNVQPAGACNGEGVDCVPLIISESVPQGSPFLNRGVGPTKAPLQNFDDGTPMRRVPFSLED